MLWRHILQHLRIIIIIHNTLIKSLILIYHIHLSALIFALCREYQSKLWISEILPYSV